MHLRQTLRPGLDLRHIHLISHTSNIPAKYQSPTRDTPSTRQTSAAVVLGHVSLTLNRLRDDQKAMGCVGLVSVEHRYDLLFRLAHRSLDRRSLSTRVGRHALGDC